jgi:hypothetical protein
MFRITKDPSSGSVELYLTKITGNVSIAQVVLYVVSVWRYIMPPNTDHARDNLHDWNIIYNFS